MAGAMARTQTEAARVAGRRLQSWSEIGGAVTAMEAMAMAMGTIAATIVATIVATLLAGGDGGGDGGGEGGDAGGGGDGDGRRLRRGGAE